MRKILLFTIFSLGLMSCAEQVHFKTEEEITVILPEWPPLESSNQTYPPLYKWIIKVDGKQVQTDENQFPLRVAKNLPSSITATPITLGPQNSPVTFYKPAGAVYPYVCNNNVELTWQNGYAATIFEQLYTNAEKCGYSPQAARKYAARYNWKKLSETVETKIQKCIADREQPFYNPWLLDTQTVLEGIAYNSFSAAKLNLTSSNVFLYQLENGIELHSSFIPENEFIAENKAVTIKKNGFNFFSLSQTYGIIISGNSAKNVLLEYIYLPIYIEDI